MILHILDCSTLQPFAAEIGSRPFYPVIPQVNGSHGRNEGNQPARARRSYLRKCRDLIARIVDSGDVTFARDYFAFRSSNEFSTS